MPMNFENTKSGITNNDFLNNPSGDGYVRYYNVPNPNDDSDILPSVTFSVKKVARYINMAKDTIKQGYPTLGDYLNDDGVLGGLNILLTDDINTMATDGRYIYMSPLFLWYNAHRTANFGVPKLVHGDAMSNDFNYVDDCTMFAIMHEIYHCFLMHHLRERKFAEDYGMVDHEHANIVQDQEINAQLEAYCGFDAIDLCNQMGFVKFRTDGKPGWSKIPQEFEDIIYYQPEKKVSIPKSMTGADHDYNFVKRFPSKTGTTWEEMYKYLDAYNLWPSDSLKSQITSNNNGHITETLPPNESNNKEKDVNKEYKGSEDLYDQGYADGYYGHTFDSAFSDADGAYQQGYDDGLYWKKYDKENHSCKNDPNYIEGTKYAENGGNLDEFYKKFYQKFKSLNEAFKDIDRNSTAWKQAIEDYRAKKMAEYKGKISQNDIQSQQQNNQNTSQYNQNNNNQFSSNQENKQNNQSQPNRWQRRGSKIEKPQSGQESINQAQQAAQQAQKSADNAQKSANQAQQAAQQNPSNTQAQQAAQQAQASANQAQNSANQAQQAAQQAQKSAQQGNNQAAQNAANAAQQAAGQAQASANQASNQAQQANQGNPSNQSQEASQAAQNAQQAAQQAANVAQQAAQAGNYQGAQQAAQNAQQAAQQAAQQTANATQQSGPQSQHAQNAQQAAQQAAQSAQTAQQASKSASQNSSQYQNQDKSQSSTPSPGHFRRHQGIDRNGNKINQLPSKNPQQRGSQGNGTKNNPYQSEGPDAQHNKEDFQMGHQQDQLSEDEGNKILKNMGRMKPNDQFDMDRKWKNKVFKHGMSGGLPGMDGRNPFGVDKNEFNAIAGKNCSMTAIYDKIIKACKSKVNWQEKLQGYIKGAFEDEISKWNKRAIALDPKHPRKIVREKGGESMGNICFAVDESGSVWGQGGNADGETAFDKFFMEITKIKDSIHNVRKVIMFPFTSGESNFEAYVFDNGDVNPKYFQDAKNGGTDFDSILRNMKKGRVIDKKTGKKIWTDYDDSEFPKVTIICTDGEDDIPMKPRSSSWDVDQKPIIWFVINNSIPFLQDFKKRLKENHYDTSMYIGICVDDI